MSALYQNMNILLQWPLKMARNEERRVKVFCVTCSFAPDDLFFPVGIAAAIKGTWFFFSFAVCVAIFARRGCDEDVPTLLAVSVGGFTFLQLLAFSHKLILFVVSARGTIREPKHKFVRELLLIGTGIYVIEICWAVFSVVAVLDKSTTSKVSCDEFQRPFTAYVVLVWLNWLELALVALVYFSCLDRCKFFCCRAVCVARCHCCGDTTAAHQSVLNDGDDGRLDVEAAIKVIPTSHSLSASYLCSLFRDKCCTCRRDGLNNSKSVALQDVSHALEVLYHDMEVHYTALDRLSGWMLVQKYHSQLLDQGKESFVNLELLQATLRFLKKKGVVQKNHVVKEPQPLSVDSKLPESLLYYYWFAIASYGWTINVFLDPVSGVYTTCRDARCVGVCGREEEEEEGVDEGGSVVFLKSAEVASIAGINNDDIFLGKTSSDIHCPPFYVCRTVRKDPVTGHERKEIVITIRGTLSIKDVMTSFTASMRDATKCHESLVEKWFLLLVKTKLKFLGVEDAYFHTGFYKSAKVILNILRRSSRFRNLVEEQHYRVVVTGHSLGAGVGAILTLLIQQKHPHWAEGLHAYLYAVPGAVCSYELAERAEELGIITSVVGAHDIVSRVSWRALTYLKLLVKKALEETSLKKPTILCCGSLPIWNPPIFGGSVYPVGLIDEQSGAATPDFFELEQSLAIVRASTWDQEAIKKERRRRLRERKREEEEKAEAAGVVQEDDVIYEERRKTNTDDDLDEVRKRLKEGEIEQEGEVKIGPVVIAPLEDCSKEKRGKKVVDSERKERVATEFLQEKSCLGPLMFLPGRVLHIEEEEARDDDGTPARWCGVGLLGLRCCGIRCTRNRPVRASWKAREDLTGIILHRDCLVDHSPRRSMALLKRLCYQASIQAGAETPSSLNDIQLDTDTKSYDHSEQPNTQGPEAAVSDGVEPSAVVVVADSNAECSRDSPAHNDTAHEVCDVPEDNTGGANTVSAEIHEHSEL